MLPGQEQGRDAALRCCAQSRKRWQAFFHRQAVHHWSRCSMPYTLRHFLASPRTFLQKGEEEKKPKQTFIHLLQNFGHKYKGKAP